MTKDRRLALRARVATHVSRFDEEIVELVFPYKRWMLQATLRGWTQGEIAEYLWVSQPTVSYLVNTTLHRCSQYEAVPRPTWNELQSAMAGFDKQTKEVLEAMYRHRQQTAAANAIGRSQGYVRYRFLEGLKELDGSVGDWLKLCTTIEPKYEESPERFPGQLPKVCPSSKSLISLASVVAKEFLTPGKKRR